MVLTLANTWKRVMAQREVEVAWLVDLELGPAAFLTVIDYTAAAGVTVRVTINGGVIVELVEGVDWNRGASNTAAATSLVAAINAHVTLSGLIIAAARGAVVHAIASNDVVNTIVLHPDSATAIAEEPTVLERTVEFAKSTRPIGNRFLSVAGLSPFSSSMDIEDRSVRTGDIEVHFIDDGTLRDVFSRSFPKGKRVTISIGEPSLDEADFAPFGTFIIDDWAPEMGGITVRCIEPYGYLLDTEITGEFFNVHPFAAIREILRQCNLPDAFIDTSSLESTDAAWADISHWSCGRHNRNTNWRTNGTGPFNGINEPTKAQDLIDDLSTICTGNLRCNEDGVFSFVRYDKTAAIVRTITLSEDEAADFEVMTTADSVISQVTLSGIVDTTQGASQDRQTIYTVKDSFAIASMSITGTPRNFTTTIETDWLGTYGNLHYGVSDTDTTFDVWPCAEVNISGTRFDTNPTGYADTFSQRTEDAFLAGKRVGYLLITDGVNQEVVEVNAFEHPGDGYTGSGSIDAFVFSEGGYTMNFTPADGLFVEPTLTPVSSPIPGGPPSIGYWQMGRFTVSQRGAKGTTARAWTSFDTRVYDVTIAIDALEARLERFAYGCPVYKLRTGMEHWDLQLGDFISVVSPIYLNYRKNGCDANTVWEIIAKETQVSDDSPAIQFTLAKVRDDVTPASLPERVDVLVPVAFVPIFDDILVNDDGIPITDDNGDRKSVV